MRRNIGKFIDRIFRISYRYNILQEVESQSSNLLSSFHGSNRYRMNIGSCYGSPFIKLHGRYIVPIYLMKKLYNIRFIAKSKFRDWHVEDTCNTTYPTRLLLIYSRIREPTLNLGRHREQQSNLHDRTNIDRKND